MKNQEEIKLLQKLALEKLDSDINVADAFHEIANYLEKKSEGLYAELGFNSSINKYQERTKIVILYQFLCQSIQLYNADLSTKELSYANDLVEKIEVGYFNDETVDSTFAQELRKENYKIDAKSAELSLQARIVSILNDVMPDGAWVVE